MERKAVSGIMLTLLLIGMYTLAFNIQSVKATGTVYIRADGSVDPPTAPISSVDNVTYTLTADISDSIVIERDNILVDGAGYALKGTGKGGGLGLDLSHRINVTLKNSTVTNFEIGIWLYYSSDNTIVGNNATGNYLAGIYLYRSGSNKLVSNNATNNPYGIYFDYSSGNTISYNTLTSSGTAGIHLAVSRNTFYGNILANNVYGISLYHSSDNIVYHCNFINNIKQVESYTSANIWDDGYPSGGNYWSDYEARYPDAEELDDSGIWDTPYVIDGDNQDNYPLMEPWSPLPRTLEELKTEIEELGSEGEIDNQGVVKSFIAKLKAAEKLVDKGKTDEAMIVLEDFMLQVQNLSGIHITIEAVDILIESAEYIMVHL